MIRVSSRTGVVMYTGSCCSVGCSVPNAACCCSRDELLTREKEVIAAQPGFVVQIQQGDCLLHPGASCRKPQLPVHWASLQANCCTEGCRYLLASGVPEPLLICRAVPWLGTFWHYSTVPSSPTNPDRSSYTTPDRTSTRDIKA